MTYRETVLMAALQECYSLAFDFWNTKSDEPVSADDLKEHRRAIGAVCAAMGVEHPLGWSWGAATEIGAARQRVEERLQRAPIQHHGTNPVGE